MASAAPVRGDVVARGRIEPLGRVLAISGPADSGLISKLLVDQGSVVAAGQVLAVLDGFDVSRADLAVAQSNLKLAELQRVQVQAGAKHSDIAAQTDVVTAKLAELVRLQKEWERDSSLYRNNFVTSQSLDALRAELDSAKSEVEQAENVLKSLTEVRGVDDGVAAAQVEVAQSNVARAQAAMDRLQIRAPTPGTVLSIQARTGEMIAADGLLRMADLSHVIVVAEVDESEIGQVSLGMVAQIDGDVLAQPINASVTRVAHEVFRQKRPASDVLIGRDAKIVEVELTPQTPLPAIMGGEVMVQFRTAQTDKH